MKIFYFISLFPLLAFPQFLAGRPVFEVSGSCRQGSFGELNQLLDTATENPFIQTWFNGQLDHFEYGKGPGVGIGYAFTHNFLLALRFDSTVYKSYNRDTVTGLLDERPVIVESNLNYRITTKVLTFNLIAYIYNSRTVGFFLGAGGGMLFDTDFREHQFFTATFLDDSSMEIITDSTLIYRQSDPSPVGQGLIGIDLALGVLTSILIEGGYRYAIIDEIKHDSEDTPLTDAQGTPVKIDLSGYYASASLRFLF